MTLKLLRIVLIIIFVVSVLFFLVWLKDYNLRKDNDKIRSDLLKETPIGMSFDKVTSKLESMNLETEPSNTGFHKQERASSEIIGVRSIRVFLGEYREVRAFPYLFLTTVDALWGFDEDGKLIEIWIWKTTDGF